MVTSHRVHLLVSGERDAIPKSIQLLAGKKGEGYNQRKRRKGAFREDHYHVRAVGSKGFVEATKERPGIKAKGQKVPGNNETYELREAAVPYRGNLTLKISF